MAVGTRTWGRTQVTMEALRARVARTFLRTRVLDKTGEVSGKKFQQVDLPEIINLDAKPVAAGGGVDPQTFPATSVSLVIDQYNEISMDFEDVLALQEMVNRKKEFSNKAGKGHGIAVEKYILALETGIAAGQRTNVAGSLTDSLVLGVMTSLDISLVPDDDRWFYASPNQTGELLAEDKFVNLDFIKSGAPVASGMLGTLYGMTPLKGPLTRRRSFTGVDRTVNFGCHREWAAVGVQQTIRTKIVQVDLAERIMTTMLFGAVLVRGDHIETLQTTDI